MTVHNGKNVKDWTIRSHSSKKMYKINPSQVSRYLSNKIKNHLLKKVQRLNGDG